MSIPSDFSGLSGWYKADAGVYKDAGVTLAAVGDTVQQWNDQSGNGRHFSQASASLRPVYGAGPLHLLFDGADDYLGGPASSGFFGTTVGTVMAVANIVVSNTDAGFQGDDCIWTDNSSNGRACTSFASDGTPGYCYSGMYDGATQQIASLANPIVVGSWIYTLWMHATSVLYCGVNGSDDTRVGTLAGADTIDTWAGNMQFARAGVGTVYSQIKIAEVVYYNTTRSNAERLALDAYFIGRYFGGSFMIIR